MGEQFSGSGNAGRPLLLDGGLKWQALSLSPADMDFVALKEGAARDIALAFGVPPVLVGLPGDATYANAREAGRALYRQTILPMAERDLERSWATMLGDWLGPVEACGRHGQIERAGRGPGAAVGAGRRGEFLSATRSGRSWASSRRRSMTANDDGRDALLARLMAQAEGRGVDLITLRALVEEASQAGARGRWRAGAG